MSRVAVWAFLASLGFGLAAGASGPAHADGDSGGAFDGLTTLESEEMAAATGRQDRAPLALDQTNATEQFGRNFDNSKINIGGTSVSGSIGDTRINDTRGTTSVMTNTGDFVNMNFSSNLNVVLQ